MYYVCLIYDVIKLTVSPLSFYSDDLSFGESRVSKSPILTVLVSIYGFQSNSVYFMKLDVLMSSAFIFTIVISCWFFPFGFNDYEVSLLFKLLLI